MSCKGRPLRQQGKGQQGKKDGMDEANVEMGSGVGVGHRQWSLPVAGKLAWSGPGAMRCGLSRALGSHLGALS